MTGDSYRLSPSLPPSEAHKQTHKKGIKEVFEPQTHEALKNIMGKLTQYTCAVLPFQGIQN